MGTVEADTIRYYADMDEADRWALGFADFWTQDRLEAHFAELIGASGLSASEFAMAYIAEQCEWECANEDSPRGRKLTAGLAAAHARMVLIYEQHIDEGHTEFRLSQREAA